MAHRAGEAGLLLGGGFARGKAKCQTHNAKCKMQNAKATTPGMGVPCSAEALLNCEF
jgi:hypothetical protein